MASVFSAPDTIQKPTYDFSKAGQWKQEENKYCEQLKEVLQKRCNQELVGEIISFPVADSKASYMVASSKPLQLVHLPLGDEWHFEFAHKLTLTDVKKKIQSAKALSVFFK